MWIEPKTAVTSCHATQYDDRSDGLLITSCGPHAGVPIQLLNTYTVDTFPITGRHNLAT